jgi:hypothetical protein
MRARMNDAALAGVVASLVAVVLSVLTGSPVSMRAAVSPSG